MVPTGEIEVEVGQEPRPAAAPPVTTTEIAAAVPAPTPTPLVVPAITPKALRSHSRAPATPGDGDAPTSSSPDADAAAGGRRRRRQQQRRKNSDAPLDQRERIKRRVKYMLIKMRVDQNLLDAYSGEGWKGQSREKIRPEQELQRAEAQILRSKLAIREAVHELDDMGLEGSLDEKLFDAEGRIYHEEIFCAKCKSQEALIENDIILCDGACNRGFHQFCLDPPLETKDIPPGDEGWLCPVCECKMECVELINAEFGTNYEVENSWEDFFSKEALVAAGGGTGDGAGGDWPSSDSEDDDYDPEAAEKRMNSEDEEEGESEEEGDIKEGGKSGEDSEDEDSDYMEEGEGREGGEEREGGEDNEGSDSGSDKTSSDSSDKDEGVTNLKKLARKGKRRRSSSSSSKEDTGSSDSSDSDASDVSFFDEFKDGGPKLSSKRRDSQAQQSASDDEGLVVEGKRQRQALDYKRLHDEMFGKIDDDEESEEDEDYGPKRRRRRTVPDDPNRPRPPRVRRRKLTGDASKRADAEGDQPTSGGDPAKGGDADGVQTSGGRGASKVVDINANGVSRELPSASQGDGTGDTPGGDREKRMWRRLPDAAVERLRRVVAVNALPSKPQKEALAAELGLSFAQVHGWFKNQRHQALRKGLVTPKRPHLVASSSKAVNAGAATTTGNEISAATEIVVPQNVNSANTMLTEKLDEVQIRLLELKETLDVFAKDTMEDAQGKKKTVGEVENNNFELGGIGLPANGNNCVVYAPAVVDVRERPPVSS